MKNEPDKLAALSISPTLVYMALGLLVSIKADMASDFYEIGYRLGALGFFFAALVVPFVGRRGGL